jgi:hypothetical protein
MPFPGSRCAVLRFVACRSSRTSRSSALIRSRSSVVGPARWPWFRSAWRTHSAASHPSSRSWQQSSRSHRIESRARPGAPTPSAQRVHGLQGKRVGFASSWLHPHKSWGLRKTRRGLAETVPEISANMSDDDEMTGAADDLVDDAAQRHRIAGTFPRELR